MGMCLTEKLRTGTETRTLTESKIPIENRTLTEIKVQREQGINQTRIRNLSQAINQIRTVAVKTKIEEKMLPR